MSSSDSTRNCSICHKNLPSIVFIRNQRINTFYKTCSICRTRKNIQRQNHRGQQSVAQPSRVALVNGAFLSLNIYILANFFVWMLNL
ncbi:hypothetical protein OnM2_004046 [Erysiphe neolycopersici]|uniref:Uncharacterized protein n=1 Tax=Erysiphe neolycopersici TaxID=212602 RepID=A0A420I7H1_9PEZI|nr:hypothetical protein OnM2_004046 [Erysiphe neolycopersici]